MAGLRRARGAAVAVAVVAAMVLVSAGACEPGGRTEPRAGEAAVPLTVDDAGGAEDGGAKDGGAAARGFGGPVRGLAFGSDGDLYSLGAGLIRVRVDWKPQVVLTGQVAGARGLVALPHGAFAVGTARTVESITVDSVPAGGDVTVLAGSPGAARTVGAPVPASVPAARFRFAPAGPVPFGAAPDGSLLIADTDVVWSLAGGRLRRVYQLSARQLRAGRTLLDAGAVDQEGTAYVGTGSRNLRPATGIMAIPVDGPPHPLGVPARADGVPEELASLNVLWLSGDDTDGVYARVRGRGGDYVLHLSPGSAKLVARYGSVEPTPTCHRPHPVDALHLRCALPTAMTYAGGRLYLGGDAGYVLKIAVP